jgi:hypothetical protein
MANRFWVGGTGTWDASDTTHWAGTSGGAGGQSVPTTGDNVIFDASSGSGTVTVAADRSGTSLATLVAGAFTGTLDFAANAPINMTFTSANSTGLNLSGTGARKFLLGTGTFTFTGGTSANTVVFDVGTVTNLDPTSDLAANFTLNATSAFTRTFSGGGRTFGTLTISANTSRGAVAFAGANTFSNWSVAAGSTLFFPGATTTTISNAPTLTGTSSNPIALEMTNTNSSAHILSVASGTVSFEWCAFFWMTGAGGATFTATNSLDLGKNSNISISPPSGGGVVGVIGG